MATITIPKKMTDRGDLVVVPREEYEKLMRFWVDAEPFTDTQKKAVTRGFSEIKNGKFLTSKQLKRELGL